MNGTVNNGAAEGGCAEAGCASVGYAAAGCLDPRCLAHMASAAANSSMILIVHAACMESAVANSVAVASRTDSWSEASHGRTVTTATATALAPS